MQAALAAATRVPGGLLMAATLPSIGLTGIATACLQAGCFVLSSHFPPVYTQVSQTQLHHLPLSGAEEFSSAARMGSCIA